MSDVFIPVRNQEGCTHVKTYNFHEESEQVEKEIIPHNIESELLTKSKHAIIYPHSHEIIRSLLFF